MWPIDVTPDAIMQTSLPSVVLSAVPCNATAPLSSVIVFYMSHSSLWTLLPLEVSLSPSPSAAASAHVTPRGGTKSQRASLLLIIAGTVTGILVLSLMILGVVVCYRRRAQHINGKVVPAPTIAMTDFAALRISSSSSTGINGDGGLGARPSLVRPLLGKTERRHSF